MLGNQVKMSSHFIRSLTELLLKLLHDNPGLRPGLRQLPTVQL